METKTEISSLDLRFLSRELNEELREGLFRKIYQYRIEDEKGKGTHEFLFEVFVPGKGERWLYVGKNKIFITTYRKPSPMEPPSFCLFLRKHLNNKKILGIRQHDFDRVVEIRTENNRLIIELFSEGNVILCDSGNNIIMPLYVQKWKDRDVKPKIPYRFPPAKVNPYSINFDYFANFMKKYESRLVAVLASGFGFGAVYAKEICVRSGIGDQEVSTGLAAGQTEKLYKAILGLDREEFRPTLYKDFVAPFPLLLFKREKTVKETKLFSEALDEYFSEREARRVEEEKEEVVKEKTEKIERVISHQQQTLERLEEKRDDRKEKADIIYKFYGTIESVLEGIQKAMNSGLPWSEIKSRISSSSSPEADAIKEIRENEGKVVVEVGGKEIELDFRKSVEENAASYYEDSKHAKKKISGASVALNDSMKRLERVPEEPVEEKPKPVKVVKKRKKWFESFRWFTSSDGFLIVGGKDAGSNERLVKKHTETGDLVFHSDIQGAPFIVIKSQEKGISEDAKKEAAEFAAAYSKAWQLGLATIDVYAVKPDQVSKQPPTGEYLPKGSFMIYGTREWFREVELKLSIGFSHDRENNGASVLAGPVMPIRKETDYFITLRPGPKPSAALATEIKNKILIKAKPEDKEWIEKITNDEISRLIPSGQGEVIEYGV